MANLLTHHDPYHIHACCGLLALLHFIYRFRLICLDVDHAGFGQSRVADFLAMILLALPNITSYLFQIVNVKKGKDGFSIWKEYRGHAFVFAAKLWLVLAFLVYKKHVPPQQDDRHQWEATFYYRIAAEFATMYGLQYVTNQYPKQISTIRGMCSSSISVFMAGFMQFLGRAVMLYGTPYLRDMIPTLFLAIMVVQLNALNMTLRKKRIIGPKTTQAFYTFLLGSGFYLIVGRRCWKEPPLGLLDPRFQFIYLALLAYTCRRQGMDRFSSWIVALSVMTLADQQFGLFREA